jgi:hypothetical protein
MGLLHLRVSCFLSQMTLGISLELLKFRLSHHGRQTPLIVEVAKKRTKLSTTKEFGGFDTTYNDIY